MGVGGNAPTPPTRPMMLGQPGPMGSQNAPSFDSPSHPYHQQMMQRQAAQQQQHTEPNGYMMGPAAGRGAAGQMVGPSGPQQFIGASQQRPPMSFGPSGPQVSNGFAIWLVFLSFLGYNYKTTKNPNFFLL